MNEFNALKYAMLGWLFWSLYNELDNYFQFWTTTPLVVEVATTVEAEVAFSFMAQGREESTTNTNDLRSKFFPYLAVPEAKAH